MIERRKSVRVECELPSSFRNLDADQPNRIGYAVVRNISQGGVKIRVDEFVPIQNRLYVYLPLPTHRTIEVQVAPSWVVELPHVGKYEIGARFIDIKQEDEEAIQNFQYQALLEKMPFRQNIVKNLLKNPPKNDSDKAA
jgi:c-di-GMP-binding flagellar brake protein YcgR